MDNVHLPLSLAGCASAGHAKGKEVKNVDEQIALKEREVLIQAKYCA